VTGPGVEVSEGQPMECVETGTDSTGSFRIVHFELFAVEEIELPSTLEEEQP